MIEKNF